MSDAVIVDAVRTPIGKGKPAAPCRVHPVDLLAHTLPALVERTGIDPALIDDVIGGSVDQVGDQAMNITRTALLAAGFPESVPGHHRRPAVRSAPAGRPLRRAGRDRRAPTTSSSPAASSRWAGFRWGPTCPTARPFGPALRAPATPTASSRRASAPNSSPPGGASAAQRARRVRPASHQRAAAAADGGPFGTSRAGNVAVPPDADVVDRTRPSGPTRRSTPSPACAPPSTTTATRSGSRRSTGESPPATPVPVTTAARRC